MQQNLHITTYNKRKDHKRKDQPKKEILIKERVTARAVNRLRVLFLT